MKKPVPIAVIVSDNQEYWRGVIHGIVKFIAPGKHWSITRFDPTTPDLPRLASLHPRGIIAAVDSPELADWIKTSAIPTVNVSSTTDKLSFPHVFPDDADIGQLAAGHFLKRGMTHFAFVGHANRADSEKRKAGFVARLAKEGVTQIADYMTAGPDGEPALTQFITDLPKPCAILAADDSLARQVLDACNAAAIRIPRDAAILGIGDDPIVCGLSFPRLSSVSLPAERVGFEAAGLLEKMLAGKRRGVQSALLPVSSVIGRGSTDIVSIDDPQVAAAVRFILAHAGEWIGVRELLLSLPLQRRSLERKFRAVLGRSPLEEIRRVRLEIARELLSTTDLAMPLVARRSGFSEAKQLSTVFRAEIGVTPTQYRAKFRVVGSPIPGESTPENTPSDEQ
ncbi:MAG: substrate-binding domain-containing protein [Tepidisphaeraceae bacterium]|jgi:LacI family transcriptional regulator